MSNHAHRYPTDHKSLNPRRPPPEITIRVEIGQRVLASSVQAHISGEPVSFAFEMPKDGKTVRFTVTVEAENAADA